MLRSSLLNLSLLIILVLPVTAHAKNKLEVFGDGPPAPRTDLLAKAAQEVANLEVAWFSGPSTALQGDNLADQVEIVFSNAGPDSILGIFSVFVFLSDTLGGRPAGDIRMGGSTFRDMAAGLDTLDVSQQLVPLTTPPGDYFLVLKLDFRDEIVETDETDNIASLPLTVFASARRTVYYEDFQDGPAGWTARDLTAQTDTFLNRIDYFDGVDTMGVWWCGDDNTDWVDPMGYGNNWDQRLEKTFTLPTGPCSLSYVIQYDSELSYDFTYVEISNNGFTTYETLASYDDHTGGAFLSYSHDISAYAGGQVQIRFRFNSDSSWSDEDGSYLSDGAFRLDEVTVTGSDTDFFETDGDDWIPTPALPMGGEFRLEKVPYCPIPFDCDQYSNGDPGVFCNTWVA